MEHKDWVTIRIKATTREKLNAIKGEMSLNETLLLLLDLLEKESKNTP